jgi:hypothetical protein
MVRSNKLFAAYKDFLNKLSHLLITDYKNSRKGDKEDLKKKLLQVQFLCLFFFLLLVLLYSIRELLLLLAPPIIPL